MIARTGLLLALAFQACSTSSQGVRGGSDPLVYERLELDGQSVALTGARSESIRIETDEWSRDVVARPYDVVVGSDVVSRGDTLDYFIDYVLNGERCLAYGAIRLDGGIVHIEECDPSLDISQRHPPPQNGFLNGELVLNLVGKEPVTLTNPSVWLRYLDVSTGRSRTDSVEAPTPIRFLGGVVHIGRGPEKDWVVLREGSTLRRLIERQSRKYAQPLAASDRRLVLFDFPDGKETVRVLDVSDEDVDEIGQVEVANVIRQSAFECDGEVVFLYFHGGTPGDRDEYAEIIRFGTDGPVRTRIDDAVWVVPVRGETDGRCAVYVNPRASGVPGYELEL